MKRCDLCQNEATVFYQVTVNGKTEQKHLCAECAKKEGIPMEFDAFEREFSRMDRSFSELAESFFDAPMRFFDTPFAPAAGLFGSDLFALPKASEPGGDAKKEAKSDPKPEAAAEHTPPQKSIAALKAELKRAVKREDYLTAAALRDQIRARKGDKQDEK